MTGGEEEEGGGEEGGRDIRGDIRGEGGLREANPRGGEGQCVKTWGLVEMS